MRRGLLERFGSEIIDKVFSEGQVEHTAMGNRFKVTFMLTRKLGGRGEGRQGRREKGGREREEKKGRSEVRDNRGRWGSCGTTES